jgi:hypothetical protein
LEIFINPSAHPSRKGAFMLTRSSALRALGRGVPLLVMLSLTVAACAKDKANPLTKKISPKPPKGAIVLFNGKDASQWVKMGTKDPIGWKIEDGALEVVPGTGYIESVPRFTDFQLHVEFNEPYMPNAHGQERGNSGVYLQGLYEIQVLDSYENDTYADGACGAIYGQHPPRVNASKKPGEWQTYDITYTAPRFDDKGNVTEKAYATVYQNGTLIQDHADIIGATTAAGSYDRTQQGPIVLQDHGCKVRYRNIWIKPLKSAKK